MRVMDKSRLCSICRTPIEETDTLVRTELGPAHEKCDVRTGGGPVGRLRRSVLTEAHDLVHGARMRDYAHPRVNLERIAVGWTEIFGVTVTPRQVGLAMVWLKIARDIATPKHDNLVDGAGYFEVLHLAEDKEEPT